MSYINNTAASSVIIDEHSTDLCLQTQAATNSVNAIHHGEVLLIPKAVLNLALPSHLPVVKVVIG